MTQGKDSTIKALELPFLILPIGTYITTQDHTEIGTIVAYLMQKLDCDAKCSHHLIGPSMQPKNYRMIPCCAFLKTLPHYPRICFLLTALFVPTTK